jgi:CHAT domain-containing protein
MTSDEFVTGLLSASNAQERQKLIAAHPEHLCLDTVRALKSRADWVERDDARQALLIGQLAEELAQSIGQTAAHGYAAWIRANAHSLLGAYDVAVQEYERATASFYMVGQTLEVARVRIGHVSALMYLGEYDRARRFAEEARSVFVAEADSRSLATIDLNLGNIHARLEQHPQALDYLQRALGAYDRLGDAFYAAIAKVNLANVLLLSDEFLQAERLYLEAQPVFEAARRQSLVAALEHNLAHLRYACGNYAESLQAFERARLAFTELAVPADIAGVDLYESDIYLDLNLPETALHMAEQAEQTYADLGLNFELARARANRAVALARLERGDQTDRLLSQARDLFYHEGNEVWVAHTDLQRAEVLSRQGKRAVAYALAAQAGAAYQQFGLKAKQAYAHILCAELLADEGIWAKALLELDAAQQPLAEVRVPWLVQRSEADYGRIHEGLGNLAQAIDHYQRAAQQMEQMVVSLSAEEHRSAFVTDKLAPYEALVAYYASCDAAAAFRWAERAKSRALVELLAAGVHPRIRATDEVDARRMDRLQLLREELNWLYARVTRGAEPGQSDIPVAGPEVWHKIQENERQVTALWRDLQAKHAEPLSLQRVAPAALEEIQQELRPGTGLVEYFVARDQITIFLVTRREVRVYPNVTSLSAVLPLMEGLSFQFAKFQYGATYLQRHREALLTGTLDVLAQLGKLLLAPLGVDLAPLEALIIVPHGALHALPFHALLIEGRHLVETHTISYAPSASVLPFCWQKPRPTSQSALLVGVPDERTAHVTEEVQALAHDLPAATILLNGEATFDRVRAHVANCDLLHLAAHGLFRSNAPLLSGIQLADRWIAVQDIYDLELKASLVTLSACETGLNKVTGGDELVGLTRGFLYAGAASLLVSLWVVDDHAVTELMIQFYRALLAGRPKAQALSQAQRSILSEYPHPYYWAPLVLVGSER